MDTVHLPHRDGIKTTKKGVKMPKSKLAKTYSLDKGRVENLKLVMKEYGITFRGDADAIHKAIDKYIIDLKLTTGQKQDQESKIGGV